MLVWIVSGIAMDIVSGVTVSIDDIQYRYQRRCGQIFCGTFKHGGTPAITPCTGYCCFGTGVPSLVLGGGALALLGYVPFCPLIALDVHERSGCPSMCRCRSTRSLWQPSKTHIAEQVGAPGVQAPPTRPPRLGPLESPGRFLAKWLPPIFNIIALGRWMFQRLRQDDCSRSLCLAPPAKARVVPYKVASVRQGCLLTLEVYLIDE